MADLMGEAQIKVLMERHITYWPDGGYTINRGDMLAFAKELMSALHPAGTVRVDSLALHELRMELHAMGEQITDVAALLADTDGTDDASGVDLETAASELTTAGSRLRAIAGVCGICEGTGQDGDEDGVGPCACNGGFNSPFPPPSSEAREAQAAEYQAWLDTPEGQAAEAAAMQPQETPHG